MTTATKSISLRYLPKRLTRKDRKTQANMIKKSRRLYKKGDFLAKRQVVTEVLLNRLNKEFSPRKEPEPLGTNSDEFQILAYF
jgi:hypothetical protein